MKIATSSINSFLSKDFPKFKAILLYGPDTGLITERINTLTHNFQRTTPGLSSLYKIDFPYNKIVSDISLLTNEVLSNSLLTTKKIISINEVKGQFIKPLEEIILNNTEHLLIFRSEDLLPSSSIRKFFETEKNVAALPCYKESLVSIKKKIYDLLEKHNLALENHRDLDYIMELYQGSYNIIEDEIQKIILYHNNTEKIIIISTKLLYEIININYSVEYDLLFEAIGNLDITKSEKIINTMTLNGENIVGILRHLSSFFL